MRIATLLLAALLLAALVLLPACSDDGPTAPATTAKVVVTVVDESGDPVPDMELNILNENHFMQDGKGLKATTSIAFQVPVACRAKITIADVAGRVIRTLIDDMVPAGRHRVLWNGWDDAEIAQLSGRYETRLVCSDEAGAVLFEDATPMLMAILDMDRAVVGRTDSDGRILLTDRTLFPHLYGLPDMHAYDEDGNITGTIELTSLMRFYVRPAEDGRYGARYDVDVTSSRQDIRLTWREPSEPLVEKVNGEPRPVLGDAVVPDGEFFLSPCYPNPFN